MTSFLRKHWGDIATVFLGGLTALVLFPLTVESMYWLRGWYDEHNPVATARLTMVERVDKETLRMQFMVTRHRECDVVRMVAFTGQDEQTMQGATTMRREDSETPISYPVGMTVLSQPWILRPVYGQHLWVYGYYDCHERIVKTPLIKTVTP